MVLLVQGSPLLLAAEALEQCYGVMDLLCEQCLRQQDMNEVLAMKMHYISCVLQRCLTHLRGCDDHLDALVMRWALLLLGLPLDSESNWSFC
jgi:hypothetical protein